jgi:putative transposase
MPDHCHAVVSVPREGSLSEVMRGFKRITSRMAGVKWQRGFFDHRLRHDESSAEKYDYIMANPVRAGLLREGEVWPHVFTA